MSIPKTSAYTVDEYLAIDRASPERYQYLDGEIFLMAGESDRHGDISVNLVGILFNQLRGKPCRVRTKDAKVRSGPAPKPGQNRTGMFSYPDILVLCDEPEYHDEHKDIILNPRVIIEVLSPTTEAFDRGEKWKRFQLWNASLRDYLLVSQDQAQIEHFTRQDKSWTFSRYVGLDATVPLVSIECRINLKDVYERVVFPADVEVS